MMLDLLILIPAVLFAGACVAEAILEVYEGARRRWTRYKLREQSVRAVTEPPVAVALEKARRARQRRSLGRREPRSRSRFKC
jgi:hypothetical protein